jgi:hypothetical protein
MCQGNLDGLWVIATNVDTEAMRLKTAIETHGVFTKKIYNGPVVQSMLVLDMGERQLVWKRDTTTTYVRYRLQAEDDWGPWRSCAGEVLG